MANKMLIDATHPEETRVVVLRGNRVEEFDFESAHRKQLRGNIYLAKVTRVEPSLQAAFVDYGGNRHGFLAFSEIHPDYYQIPVADRQALIDEEERAQRDADDEIDRRSRRRRDRSSPAATRRDEEVVRSEPSDVADEESAAADEAAAASGGGDETAAEPAASDAFTPPDLEAGTADTADITDIAVPEISEPEASAETAGRPPYQTAPGESEPGEPYPATAEASAAGVGESGTTESSETIEQAGEGAVEANDQIIGAGEGAEDGESTEHAEDGEEVVESVGGADALEEVPDRAPRYRRQYKIQEVIKRRQVMLVQVVKEERGTKGAALTTYLSLAGRYSVLMPNTARGGGISRKITNAEDRSRLKEVAHELEVPEGMGVILRTAGASRTKTEIKRDFEYLLRLWETVRDLTLKSTAPKLVYEEGSLVKRSIRDLYGKDIEEVLVAGPDAYHEAKDFMRMLMPSHAKDVKLYAETQPLLSRHGVENQLDAMFSPVVQLRSGGYIVLNQAEALVAIDVNSGRATREHHIEDTALKTNLEAAEEIARQLRLRDLAGLIVIDFIDMDEKRNNRSVERRLKECLKHDRARIQVGRISHFGLLEMSRQRIRASVLESSTEKCPYCGGSGHVRSVSSLALQVLRALEEHLMKGATHNLIVRTRHDVADYVLNQKRAHLRGLEERFAVTVTIKADDTVVAPQAFVIDRGELVHTLEAAKALAERAQPVVAPLEEEDDLEDASAADEEDIEAAPASAASEHGEGGSRRRRRRRRRGRNGGGEQAQREQPNAGGAEPAPEALSANHEAWSDDHSEQQASELDQAEPSEPGEAGAHGRYEDRPEPHHDGERRRRRRGRRGGRRNRHERNGGEPHVPQHAFAPDEELAEPPATEPELKEAVADLDAAPSAPPAPTTAEEPQAPAAEPEPPRRRSTVREPVSFAGGTDAPPAAATPQVDPEPAASEDEPAADTNRPRRTGWWSRRFAGG